MTRPCRNCDAYLKWGVLCGDCVRAMLLGAAGVVGTVGVGAVLDWVLRGITR